MTTSSTQPDRLAVYRRILKRFIERLSSQPTRIHLPTPTSLRRPAPGMAFHLTPELFLQEEGCTEFTCPADAFPLKKSELALMPRGVPHGEIAIHGRHPFQAMVACFHETNQLTLIVSKQSHPGGKPVVDFSDHFNGPEVSAAIRYLDDAASVPKTSLTAKKQRAALVFTALASIQDLLLSPRLENPAEPGPHPKVAQCRELIRAYLNNPDLSATDLARQVGCTADHLSRCFRREMGMSLFDYLRQQRLIRARALLQVPDLNISEIAWACGFSSLNYFVRSFRQTLGKSPGKSRRNLAPNATAVSRDTSISQAAQIGVKIRSSTSSGRSAFNIGLPRTT